MFLIVLSCRGLTKDEGLAAPADIEEEFTHRDWHSKAACTWDGCALRLTVENDFDATGQATLDEFSDAIHACINYSGEIHLAVESIAQSPA